MSASMSYAVRYGDLDLVAFLNTYVRAMQLRGGYRSLADQWKLPSELATGQR